MKLVRARTLADAIGYVALNHGWTFLAHQPSNRMVSYKKEDMRVNVYYTTMTIATCMNHPVKGKTQLFRRDVTLEQLEEIFKNPRVHTLKGYYRRNQ